MQFREVVTEAWSTVWRSTTPTDQYWFKQATSANPAEGGVQDVHSRPAPDLVDAPLAWDDERGWLLTTDGGQTVAETVTSDLRVLASTTTKLLRDYARLQLATVDHRDELINSGLPDKPPTQAVALFRRCIDTMAAVPADDPRHLTSNEVDLLSDAIPSLNDAAAALTAGSVPLAFDHNDLFPRNVFAPIASGSYRFFDFAESVWAHPSARW